MFYIAVFCTKNRFCKMFFLFRFLWCGRGRLILFCVNAYVFCQLTTKHRSPLHNTTVPSKTHHGVVLRISQEQQAQVSANPNPQKIAQECLADDVISFRCYLST